MVGAPGIQIDGLASAEGTAQNTGDCSVGVPTDSGGCRAAQQHAASEPGGMARVHVGSDGLVLDGSHQDGLLGTGLTGFRHLDK